MIEIINIYKRFGRNQVLRGANLTIETGETMTIIGRSGEGKSVLLKHIIGLLMPDSGIVKIDGEDITKFNNEQMVKLRMRFGMLFQGAALFDSMTVDQNVGLGLREHNIYPESKIEVIVRETLGHVGLEGIESKKPAELSGGMKKRVGLARAIAMNPEYILFDEPTTGLDPIMADAINELIILLKNTLKTTSVAVTHDMISAYKISDRIAMLYKGEIIFVGTPDEVKNSDSEIVQQFIHGSARGPITDE
jgi:phospholipid/cholesterol/gamma-HCH transport system ATP-binding protein